MKDIKTLVIPDVHCRDFWKEPVKDVLENYPDGKVIFLGDYFDGYPFEWEPGFDYPKKGVENFKEILELKKKYGDRLILLIGNHDGSYAISTDVCDCRRDRRNAKEIEGFFEDNRGLFQIAYEEKFGDKRVIYSHAGIFKKFVEEFCADMEITDENVVDKFNEAWRENNGVFLENLGTYDIYRGWGGVKYASPLWADIRSWVEAKEEDTYGFNVVGHTMCKFPILFPTIANIDCQEAFYLNADGDILHYSNDKKIEPYKL